MDLRGLMVAIKTSPCCTGCFCSISGLDESKKRAETRGNTMSKASRSSLYKDGSKDTRATKIAKLNRIEATVACRGTITLSSTQGQTCRWANRNSMRTKWGSREGIVIGTI